MKTTLLTHIVPALPPLAGEAGEYALNLARQLRDQHGINSQFILCNPKWDAPSRIDGFVIRCLRLPNEARLWGMLAGLKDAPEVLLHYDGYGYDQVGIPLWLVRGIQSWLSDSHGSSTQARKGFSTVFHELWKQSSRPWQAAFYVQLLQKRLAQQLHQLSQDSFSNTLFGQLELDAAEAGKARLIPYSNHLSGPDKFSIAEEAIVRVRITRRRDAVCQIR